MDWLDTGLVVVIVPVVLAWLSRAGALSPAKPGELRYSRGLRWSWFALGLGLVPSVGFSLVFMLVKTPAGWTSRPTTA